MFCLLRGTNWRIVYWRIDSISWQFSKSSCHPYKLYSLLAIPNNNKKTPKTTHNILGAKTLAETKGDIMVIAFIFYIQSIQWIMCWECLTLLPCHCRLDRDIEPEDFKRYPEKVQISLEGCPVQRPPAALLLRHRANTSGSKQSQKVKWK